MESRYYKIAWCDDKIESILEDANRRLVIEKYHCEIIPFTNAKTLFSFLDTSSSIINGVIVDYNMGKSDDIIDNDDSSGFNYVCNNLDRYTSIPFYLCSGRDGTEIKGWLKRMKDYEALNTFFDDSNPRFYPLGSIDKLLSKLTEEIEKMSTPEYSIRQMNLSGFIAAEHLGLDTQTFVELLLLPTEKDQSRLTVDKLNTLRCQLEEILCNILVDKQILPKNIPFNEIPILLSGMSENNQTFKLNSQGPVMDKTLASALKYFLCVLQDGSHSKSDLSIEAREYFGNNYDPYLIKSFVYICLDSAIWAEKIIEKYEGHAPLAFQIALFKANVHIDGGFAYVKNNEGSLCLIDRQKDEAKKKLEEGDEIRIFKTIPNTNKQLRQKYPLFISSYSWEYVSDK